MARKMPAFFIRFDHLNFLSSIRPDLYRIDLAWEIKRQPSVISNLII